jgi:hypothetical protein
LHHKVKPKPLLINEIDKKEKFMLLDELKLNHHKYRFIVLPILNSSGEAISKFALNKHIIIQYSGSEKAKIIKQNIITPVY